jgi:lipid-A-disaccharide synthase
VLGASLILALKQALPAAEFYRIAGPRMQAQGCKPLFAMEQLAVMGFVDVLAKLPTILGIRRKLTKLLLANPPDIFIGIDAPDFNLPLEVKLKRTGIPVVHYVSPTIWAWRAGRIKQMAKGVDLMLTLFPFEVELYQRHGIQALCVGHPLASELPDYSMSAARSALGLPQLAPIVALLPGSRKGELDYIAEPMLQAAKQLLAQMQGICFITPMVNATLAKAFQAYIQQYARDLPIKIVFQQSDLALAAADCAMVKSGTSTLQAMLLAIPQVVVFKMNRFNAHILRFLVKTPFIAFPNILAGKSIVPELLQTQATPAVIADEIMNLLTQPDACKRQQQAYAEAAQGMQGDASVLARDAILALLAHT